ncbi:MAG: 50S ribosomal protein L21 [Chitinophagales bacterium]|jgi:large subunit ribosomal protein L21|nr:50S ribosomal protein L21 [Chitinophagales bacterium]
MYTIVAIAGQQFKVEAGNEIFVHRLQGNAGDKVEFDQVLLQISDGGIVKNVAAPKVSATIVDHMKGDKVIAFKKKRRKGYKKKIGHRQYFTRIKIDEIA